MDCPRDLTRAFDEAMSRHAAALRSMTTQGERSAYMVKYDAVAKAVRDLYAAQPSANDTTTDKMVGDALGLPADRRRDFDDDLN